MAQLDRLHATFLKMNASGVIFVAALNGSALGLGAEFAWACDLRVMADEDFFIGQPEVLLGIMPGGGGSQRLTRLIGTHRSLVAILEGKPFTPAQALANGAVDEVVAPRAVVIAGDRARRILRQAAKGVGRGDQTIGVFRRLDVAGGGPARRAHRVPRHRPVSEDGQQLMLHYLASTDSAGELPLYHGDIYDRALESGTVPAARRQRREGDAEMSAKQSVHPPRRHHSPPVTTPAPRGSTCPTA